VKPKEPTPDLPLRRSLPASLLEWFTTGVLVLVLAALGWMAVADLLPTPWHLVSLEIEIFGVLGLLTAAILLVSVLALLHTRNSNAL
jgi:hypothetical protein